MIKFNRNVLIDAPLERVFDFLAQPENYLIVWPGMVEVANVHPKPNGGHIFDWVYKMAGVRFHGRADTIEFQRPRLITSKNEGGIPSTIRWTLEAKDNGTRLLFESEYTIPSPILGRIAESVVAKMNEHEAEVLLSNIKQNVEALTKGVVAQPPRTNANAPR